MATKYGYKDSEYYSKAYSYCKKFQDSDDMCNLVMKLFGSAEDKRLANVVADWIKGKKYEGSPKKALKEEPVKDDKKSIDPRNINPNCMSNTASFGYPFPPSSMYVPPFSFPQHYSPYPGSFSQNRFGNRGRGGYSGGYSRRGRCLFCKEEGHFVAECPKIKKE